MSAHFLFFLFHGHIAHALPMNRPFFFTPMFFIFFNGRFLDLVGLGLMVIGLIDGWSRVMGGIGCGHTQRGYTGSKILNKLHLLLKFGLANFLAHFFFLVAHLLKKKNGDLFFVPIFRPFFCPTLVYPYLPHSSIITKKCSCGSFY